MIRWIDRLFDAAEFVAALLFGYWLGVGNLWWFACVGFLAGRFLGHWTALMRYRHLARMYEERAHAD